MAVGTKGGLLEDEPLQSYLKHELLRKYVIKFVQMLGQGTRRPLTLVDGYAGDGRYPDGKPGSAELLLQAAAADPPKPVRVELVEPQSNYTAQLRAIAAEYAPGVQDGVEVYPSRIEKVWGGVIERAAGRHLFLFLDPCGGTVSMDTLEEALVRQRAGMIGGAKTELLMNFSGYLVRRIGGLHAAGFQLRESVLTDMCGGTWWKKLVDQGRKERPEDFARALELIALRYAEELSARTEYLTAAMPVRAKVKNQPVYYMVFATKNEIGMWEFNDSAARAQQAWMKREDLEANPGQGSLFYDEQGALGMMLDEARRQLRTNALAVVKPHWIEIRHLSSGLLKGVLGMLKDFEVRDELEALAKETGSVELDRKSNMKPGLVRIRQRPS